MQVRIKRFDKSLPLPEYKTKGAAGFDLAAREGQTVPPRTIAYIPLNVAIEPPEGYFVLLATRSSLHKRGLMAANGIGIIDRDYAGDKDEYIAVLYNYTDKPVTIESGDRLMQGVFVPHVHGTWEEVEEMGKVSRGGFGTTGDK